MSMLVSSFKDASQLPDLFENDLYAHNAVHSLLFIIAGLAGKVQAAEAGQLFSTSPIR